MFLQLVITRELLPTHCAVIGLLPCVYAAMFFEIPVGRKHLATYRTLERLVCVDPEVCLQCAIIGELLVAYGAMERPFSRVDPEVSLQVCAINEPLAAQSTVERFVPGMSHNVVL
jgi:hypothetical protein